MSKWSELKQLAEGCDASKCADESEEMRMLAEFHSEFTPEDVLALIAENERLRTTLKECASSLEGELLAKYHGQSPEQMHPVTRRDYDWDMREVAEYRAAVTGGAA